MSSYDEIKKQLQIEQEKMEAEIENDIVKKTVANLIRLEKISLYGTTPSGKKAKIDEIINKALVKYREQTDAS